MCNGNLTALPGPVSCKGNIGSTGCSCTHCLTKETLNNNDEYDGNDNIHHHHHHHRGQCYHWSGKQNSYSAAISCIESCSGLGIN